MDLIELPAFNLSISIQKLKKKYHLSGLFVWVGIYKILSEGVRIMEGPNSCQKFADKPHEGQNDHNEYACMG